MRTDRRTGKNFEHEPTTFSAQNTIDAFNAPKVDLCGRMTETQQSNSLRLQAIEDAKDRLGDSGEREIAIGPYHVWANERIEALEHDRTQIKNEIEKRQLGEFPAFKRWCANLDCDPDQLRNELAIISARLGVAE